MIIKTREIDSPLFLLLKVKEYITNKIDKSSKIKYTHEKVLNHRNNALDPRGRADSDNGGVSFGRYEGDRVGYSRQGDGNKSILFEKIN